MIFEDQLNDLILFTDEVTYNKNDDIIFTKNKSELIKKEINIKAKEFNFDRKLRVITAETNVEVIDKLNDYFGESEKIKYLINLEKIQTFGKTNAKIESTYDFFGSDVTLLRNKNELYSLSKSKIRDKDFSQYESDEFVYYFKDQFLKGKNIIFISDNSVPKGNAELAKFSNGFFDLKNKTYKAKDTSINIKKSTFDNSKNDPRIKGVSSESKNGVKVPVKPFHVAN